MKKSIEEIKELVSLCYDGDEKDAPMSLDGLDEAIIGTVERFGMSPVLAYDYDKVIKLLTKDGMNEEEAIEWFDYHTLGAWVGEGTPAFVTVMRKAK